MNLLVHHQDCDFGWSPRVRGDEPYPSESMPQATMGLPYVSGDEPVANLIVNWIAEATLHEWGYTGVIQTGTAAPGRFPARVGMNR